MKSILLGLAVVLVVLSPGCAQSLEEIDRCSNPVERRVELIREAGQPQELSFHVDTTVARCITVEAGWPADGPEGEAVPAPSAAWIEVGGKGAAGPDRFNGRTWRTSWMLPVSGGMQEIRARIASEPGSGLRFWVHTIVPEDTQQDGPEAWVPGVVAYRENGGASLTLVHPNGGNLYATTPAGVTIDVLNGYLDDNPYGTDVLGFAFDIGPDGQINDPPLIATVSWPAGAVTDEQAKHLRVLLKTEATGVWEAAPVLARSIEGRYIRVAVRHHSWLTLILPDVLQSMAIYVADKAVEYASSALDLAYGQDAGQNHFADFAAGTSGANSANFVNQAVTCGFLGCSDSFTAYMLRGAYDTASESVHRIFYESELDYGESWRNPADFQNAIRDGYTQSSGFHYQFIQCDTLTGYFDYTQARPGDVITGDFPKDFVPDPGFIPDGWADFVFLVSSIEPARVGYDEVRLTYQDTEGHSNIGLGTLNDLYYKRAIFCLWRPVDMNPVGDTGDADADRYPDAQACETCNSIETCQAMVDSIIAEFPDYASVGTAVTFKTWEDTVCESFHGARIIRCPRKMVDGARVTNKLLFHELGHVLRSGRLDTVGSAGECAAGNCNSSEFQASLLESFYFPGSETECLGGHYTFTDTNDTPRRPSALMTKLRQSPAPSEAELWDYAMGRNDTLVNYLGRFGVDATYQMYQSQTWR